MMRGLASLLLATLVWSAALAQDGGQADFASAAQAASKLAEAVRHDDRASLLSILGSAGEPLIVSGDEVADKAARKGFVSAYDTAHRIEMDGSHRATLRIGRDNWPMPIPIVESGGRWRFDTEAGAQKIIDRRVGRNELDVIEVCRAYVSAQREFAAARPLEGGRREYAGHFRSTPGQHDGLYWDAAAGEAPSPLGPLIVQARAEGYSGGDRESSQPYHGYFYRILTKQGPHAPGGAHDYRGEAAAQDETNAGRYLRGGFALIAFPARWGDSGIMTFIVNQDGIVFQKNLGPDTARLASEIDSFDPDLSWTAH